MAPYDSPHAAPPPYSPLGPADPREVAGYELRARLGSGGMGSVYLSYTRGGQPIAVKVVRAEFAEDPEFRRRFAQEVKAARRVQGLYTVPVLDSNTEGAAPWLATAYIPGLSLADAVRTHGRLPLPTVLLLAAGVAEALQSIHAAGVIHRDLKPGNVLLSADGPKVIDFGIARAADTTPLTGSDVRVGTPAYMAPEQVTGVSATPAADVFALGLIAHHAATGGHPFGEGTAHAVMYRIVQEAPDLSGTPAGLLDLIHACLAKDPSQRPQPAQVIEMCRALLPDGDLRRREGWLPAPVAAEVARRTQAPPPPAAQLASDGQPPRTPGAPPAAAPMAPGDTPQSPPASPPARGARRTAALLAAPAVATAVLGGAATYFLLGDSSEDAGDRAGEAVGNTTPPAETEASAPEGPADTDAAESPGTAPDPDGQPDSDSAYRLAESDVELIIKAPRFHRETQQVVRDCLGADLTTVRLDTLTVTTGVRSGSMDDRRDENDIRYIHCDHEGLLDQGISFHKDLHAGAVDTLSPTPEQCFEAARSATLPNPIPVDDILEDRTLRESTAICAETREKSLVLLRIDRVQADPHNEDLRSYTMTATRWTPQE
ncbi:hypothetical protein GCM10009716_13870 [Streptomyces sodiiphilus]|uniref:Protein kinase domain-containing protein n=1 Tax=Streptomyces sodiiphilus TaxID=226217 RepID=A0ABP5A7H3_9ACTN